MFLHTLRPLCSDLINTLQFSERYFFHKEGDFCPRDRKVRSCSIIDDLPGQALSYLSPPDLSLAIIHHKLKLYSGGAARAPLSAQPLSRGPLVCFIWSRWKEQASKPAVQHLCCSGQMVITECICQNRAPLTSGPSAIFFSYLLVASSVDYCPLKSLHIVFSTTCLRQRFFSF